MRWAESVRMRWAGTEAGGSRAPGPAKVQFCTCRFGWPSTSLHASRGRAEIAKLVGRREQADGPRPTKNTKKESSAGLLAAPQPPKKPPGGEGSDGGRQVHLGHKLKGYGLSSQAGACREAGCTQLYVSASASSAEQRECTQGRPGLAEEAVQWNTPASSPCQGRCASGESGRAPVPVVAGAIAKGRQARVADGACNGVGCRVEGHRQVGECVGGARPGATWPESAAFRPCASHQWWLAQTLWHRWAAKRLKAGMLNPASQARARKASSGSGSGSGSGSCSEPSQPQVQVLERAAAAWTREDNKARRANAPRLARACPGAARASLRRCGKAAP